MSSQSFKILEFNSLKSFNHFYNYFVTWKEQRVEIENCEHILANVNVGMNGLVAFHLEYISNFHNDYFSCFQGN